MNKNVTFTINCSEDELEEILKSIRFIADALDTDGITTKIEVE